MLCVDPTVCTPAGAVCFRVAVLLLVVVTLSPYVCVLHDVHIPAPYAFLNSFGRAAESKL